LNFQLPDKDLLFRPETELADDLGVEITGKSVNNIIDIYGIDCLTDSWTSTFKAKGSKVLAKVHGKDRPCVIKKRAGRGEVVIAGIGLPHTFDYHIDIVRKLCGELGLRLPEGSPAPEVHRVRRVSAKAEFDFMMNYHDEPRMVTVNGQRTALHNRSGIIVKSEK
jgi:beta-galactosidase GanA